ncbi:MAG: hypothetical protein ACYDBX_00260 [Patescibacteria group bacterium]
MEKSKLVIISLSAGIISAVLLFLSFSLGAVFGSHLRFYGYHQSNGPHQENITILGKIESFKNNILKVSAFSGDILSLRLSKHTVIKSLSGKIEKNKSVLSKKGTNIYIKKQGGLLIIIIL